MAIKDYRAELAAAAASIGLSQLEVVQPADGFVVLNGIRMHYLDWGAAQRPPLLLLHGGGLNAHTWDYAALWLRRHYHVIALDHRGHGDTDWSPENQLGEDAWDLILEDVTQFIDWLGYSRIFLTGMSMGGITAYRYAARHPEKLRALGIVDIAPEMERTGLPRRTEYRTQSRQMRSFDDLLAYTQQQTPGRPEAHTRYSLMHSLRQDEDGGVSWKYDARPGALKRKAQDPSTGFHDVWEDVRAIRTPTLLFRGGRSNTLSREIAESVVAQMQDAEWVEIDGAGHNVQSARPIEFATRLHEFFQRKAPGGA